MKTTINEQQAAIQSCLFWLLSRRHDVVAGVTNKDLSDAEREQFLEYTDLQIAALQDAMTALRGAYQFRKQLGAFLSWEPVEMEDEPEGSE